MGLLMPIRVECPSCGRLEEYEPDEEDLASAKERGLAFISFYHIDHVLVVYFDASGAVRRTAVLKSVKEFPTPSMPFEDLLEIVGKERLALMLAALASGGRVVLSSFAKDLAEKVYMALRNLLEPISLSAEIASDEESLKAVADRPPGTVVIADKSILAGAIGLPSHVLVVDLDSRSPLEKKERRALKPLVKTLDEASKLREESSKLAVVRSRLLKLKVLIDRAMEVLDKVSVIGETALRRKLDPGMSSEELRLLLFLLDRFRGVDVEEKVVRGAREFFLPGWMESL